MSEAVRKARGFAAELRVAAGFGQAQPEVETIRGFAGELKAAAGFGQVPLEVEIMLVNLDKMARLLQTMQALPTKTGQDGLLKTR